MTWKRLYVTPISRTRVMVGVAIGPPKVPALPNPASSIRMMRTLGAPAGAAAPASMVQSLTESSSVRPATPPKALSRIGSTERSGTNLCPAWASASLRPRTPLPSMATTERAGVPASARSAASRSSWSTMAITAAAPGASWSPRPSSIPLATLCRANVPTRPPAAAPVTTEPSSGGEKRPTITPTPPPQPRPLRPRWSPVWRTVTRPCRSRSTRIRPSLRTWRSLTARARASKSLSAASAAGYAAMIRS